LVALRSSLVLFAVQPLSTAVAIKDLSTLATMLAAGERRAAAFDDDPFTTLVSIVTAVGK